MASTSEILYIESTLPIGLTIDAYRRSRPHKPSLSTRLKAILHPRLRLA